MLAMADRDGIIEASVPGLAVIARVPIESVIKALESFTSPDQWSRTKEHEGRRIVEIDGGWQLLNYDHYRGKMDAVDQQQKAAERKRRQRARHAMSQGVTPCHAVSRDVTNVTRCHDIAEAKADAKEKAHTLQSVRVQRKEPDEDMRIAGFGSPEQFGDWWEALVAGHPNRNKAAVARSYILERILARTFSVEAFSAGYEQLRANSPQWLDDRGRYCPNLYQIIADDLWKYAPAAPKKSDRERGLAG